MKVDREESIKAQKESNDLKKLFEQALSREPTAPNNADSIVNGLLVKNREDKFGNLKILLVVPEGIREKIKPLCQEVAPAHLGSTKSNDKK